MKKVTRKFVFFFYFIIKVIGFYVIRHALLMIAQEKARNF